MFLEYCTSRSFAMFFFCSRYKLCWRCLVGSTQIPCKFRIPKNTTNLGNSNSCSKWTSQKTPIAQNHRHPGTILSRFNILLGAQPIFRGERLNFGAGRPLDFPPGTAGKTLGTWQSANVRSHQPEQWGVSTPQDLLGHGPQFWPQRHRGVTWTVERTLSWNDFLAIV